MNLLIWLDGKLVNKADATVSVYDKGVLYGDGVFEGIRLYHGVIFREKEHLSRLYDSARAIRLTIPYSPAELSAAMAETVKANNFKDCYLRLVVTRGVADLGLSPIPVQRPCTFIIADQIRLYPKEMYENGMSIIVASTVRNHPNALSPKIKSLNYLNNIMAKWECIDAGVPEAVMLNHLGYVCECTGDNIFLVKNGKILTPPEESGILVGITRGAVIELAKQLGMAVDQSNLTRYDLYTADECFLTGTGAEIVPVTKIDQRAIGTGQVGPITRQLTDAFHRLVRDH